MKKSGGKSRYLILGMLAHVPLTGYQIRKWIEHEYSYFWQASFGQIYPSLKELERDGLIKRSGSQNGANGRGQIVYAITPKGRETIQAWMREKPEVEKLRYEILLKVSFGDQTEPDVLIGHLDDFRQRCEATLTEMNGYIDRFNQQMSPENDHAFSRLTALCGISHYTAMRDWALEAISMLRQKEGDRT